MSLCYHYLHWLGFASSVLIIRFVGLESDFLWTWLVGWEHLLGFEHGQYKGSPNLWIYAYNMSTIHTDIGCYQSSQSQKHAASPTLFCTTFCICMSYLYDLDLVSEAKGIDLDSESKDLDLSFEDLPTSLLISYNLLLFFIIFNLLLFSLFCCHGPLLPVSFSAPAKRFM